MLSKQVVYEHNNVMWGKKTAPGIEYPLRRGRMRKNHNKGRTASNKETEGKDW